MKASSSFVLTLLDLFRVRGENPVARATTPWRGPRGRRVSFWVMTAGIAGVSVAVGIAARINVGAWGRSFAFTAAFAAIPLLTAAALQVFGFRHRDEAALAELAMTGLTRREVAFGAVYGAVVASGCFAGIVLAGFVLAAAGIDDVFLFHFLVLALLWVASVGVAVRAWILAFGRVLHLFLYTAAFAIGIYLFVGMRQIDPEWEWGIVGGMAVLAAILAMQAGRFAGLRFFAPLDWEALCRAYWLTNELVAVFEVDERRAAFRALRKRRRRAFSYDIWAAWGAGLLFKYLYILELIRPIPREARSGLLFPEWLILWGDPVGSVLASGLAVVVGMGLRRKRQRGRIWAVSGSIHLSILNHTLSFALPFLLLIVMGGVVSREMVPLASDLRCRALAVFLGLAFGGLIGLAAFSGARVWTMLLPGALLWNAMIIWFLAFYSSLVSKIGVFREMDELSVSQTVLRYFRLLMADEERTLFLIAMIFLLGLLFWPRLCQRLHRIHFSRVARHWLVNVARKRR